MSNLEMSFGRRLLGADSPAAMLALEVQHGKDAWFAQLDDFVTAVVRRSLRRERVASVVRSESDLAIRLHGVETPAHAWMIDWFALDRQQARGAWFLPTEARIQVGRLSLPYFFATYPTFAHGIAAGEQEKLSLTECPDAVCAWALLEPLFEALFAPLELRGPQAGTKSHDAQRQAWANIEAFYRAVGLPVDDVLSTLRYGSGWSRLRAPEQLAAKDAFLAALAQASTDWDGAILRAYHVQGLIQRYYAKAKKGSPARRQVLAKSHERLLAAYFGGDWLALLAYLGEEPHPDERIATALPSSRLYVGGQARVTEVAAAAGLPAAEVERMLGTYWKSERPLSPVEERVAVLRDFWQAIDAIHAAQVPGMVPLWGLIEDMGFRLEDDRIVAPYTPGLYRQRLSSHLSAQIERLWGTLLLPQWPSRLVTTASPHALLAETYGPALRFWHGCALTAWFLCEGPYSRTDLPGLATYYRRELAELDELGCLINPNLFEDLINAADRLGSPEPLRQNASTHEIGAGIAITMSVIIGNRRAGFEHLRDIITRHRRAWSAQFLEPYLRARWERELRSVATEYSRIIEVKGKSPTAKQFARPATAVANHWFGGDLNDVYGAIGEKSPVQSRYERVVPADPTGFAWAVFRELGGELVFHQTTPPGSVPTAEQTAIEPTYRNLRRLAELGVWYLQLEEALGHAASMEEFGRSKFEALSVTIVSDAAAAWSRYVSALDTAKQEPHGARPTRVRHPDDQDTSRAFGSASVSQDEAPMVGREPVANQRSLLGRLLRRGQD